MVFRIHRRFQSLHCRCSIAAETSTRYRKTDKLKHIFVFLCQKRFGNVQNVTRIETFAADDRQARTKDVSRQGAFVARRTLNAHAH